MANNVFKKKNNRKHVNKQPHENIFVSLISAASSFANELAIAAKNNNIENIQPMNKNSDILIKKSKSKSEFNSKSNSNHKSKSNSNSFKQTENNTETETTNLKTGLMRYKKTKSKKSTKSTK